VFTQRFTAASLAAVALAVVICTTVLAIHGKQPIDFLAAIGGAAVGSLGKILGNRHG
jgi:hypothetical protein